MTTGKKALIAVVGLCTALAGYEFIAGWNYVNQSVEWKLVSADSFTAECPAHWHTTEHANHPRLDRRHMAFDSRPQHPGDDSYERSLGIYDELTSTQDVDSLISEKRGRSKHSGPVRDVPLSNGIVAKSWTDVMPTVEIGIPFRTFVFKAPNGHIYTATHDIPQGWKHAWRYDRLFRRILGSMKFKDAPAPAPRKDR